MGVSLISPFFLQNAQDLRRRLDAVAAPEARALAAEAREFTELFEGWLTHRPDDAARTAAISRFLDLNRRASEFLAHLPPPSSGKEAPPSSKGAPSSGERPPASGGRGLPRVDDDEDDDS